MTNANYTLDFSEIALRDLPRVGGKNASLGELYNSLKPQGVNVLDGFATTAGAFRHFLKENNTENSLETKLRGILSGFDPDVTAELQKRGQMSKSAMRSSFPRKVRLVYAPASARN